MFLNNKTNLGLIVPAANRVESHVANEFDGLWRLYESDGKTWVVKPTNDGCGANVFVLEPGKRSARALLQSMTGNTTAFGAITGDDLLGFQNRYCVLQPSPRRQYRGEKRVIVAGGRVIAQHGRTAAAGEHRSNLLRGEHRRRGPSRTNSILFSGGQWPGDPRRPLRGDRLVYPYILEFNIVNPGGLADFLHVTGRDRSDEALDAILASLRLSALEAGEVGEDGRSWDE